MFRAIHSPKWKVFSVHRNKAVQDSESLRNFAIVTRKQGVLSSILIGKFKLRTAHSNVQVAHIVRSQSQMQSQFSQILPCCAGEAMRRTCPMQLVVASADVMKHLVLSTYTSGCA